MENDEDRLCPICYDNLDYTQNTIKLICGHEFHNSCILMIYKNAKSNNLYNTKKIRRCPFCRMDGGYLPLILPQVPLKDIHIEYVELELFKKMKDRESIKQFLDSNKCHKILTSGKNIGNQCSKKHLTDSNYCKIHASSSVDHNLE